jgi:hypothetical protein
MPQIQKKVLKFYKRRVKRTPAPFSLADAALKDFPEHQERRLFFYFLPKKCRNFSQLIEIKGI